MGLPPLRTVRDPNNSPATPSSPSASKDLKTPSDSNSLIKTPIGLGVPLPQIQLDLPGWPRESAKFLSALVSEQLLAAEDLPDIVTKIGPRASQFTKPERLGDFLVGLGFISNMVFTRFLSGQTRGLVYGSYRVLDRLSSGSVGVVFLGEHIDLRRRVAIKTLPFDETVSEQLRIRFCLESRRLSNINHPNIVKIYDAGILPADSGFFELAYQILELIPGSDLENYIYDHGLQPISTICEWGIQICRALKVCHLAGLIHRDIKPSNLLLGENNHIKLIDFGLVRDFASTLTPNRVVLGSLEFMPPEQVVDPATVGPPADVYGLGCTLFWLFTGQLPYPQAENQSAALEQIRTQLPRKAREARVDLPRELDQLLSRMLARNTAERPSVGEVQSTLEQLLAGQGASPTAKEDQIRQLEDELVLARQQSAQSRYAFLSTLSTITATIPGETVEHQKRLELAVRTIAPHLAVKSNWPMLADPRQVEDYARSIMLHDLGLLQLGSQGKSLAAHVTIGDEILQATARDGGQSLPVLRLLRMVIRHHHEAWNGSGYPDGLKEDGIPPIARLAAVLITYDDLRRGALDQPPMTHANALRYLQSAAKFQLDPDVVEAFVACENAINRNYWNLPEPGVKMPPEPSPLETMKPAVETSTGTGISLRRWRVGDTK